MSSIKIVEIIFMGTGTSSVVPNITCLTDRRQGCKTCSLAMTEGGRKNRRNNTSLLVRFQRLDQPISRIFNVLIDAGKTFYESALNVFPQHGITKIDAVILTHGHADACFGLDDLRPFTIFGSIPVYLSQDTLDTVTNSFPYLVDSSKATGGGEVATFDYRIVDPNVPFDFEGLEFIPLPVEHGTFLDQNRQRQPFICLGFRFDDISYVSDTNRIPDNVMKLMEGSRYLILDCLRESSYPSHLSDAEAIDIARALHPFKTYFTGMSHAFEHDEFEARLKKLEQSEGLRCAPAFDGERVDFRQPNVFIESSHFTEPHAISLVTTNGTNQH